DGLGSSNVIDNAVAYLTQRGALRGQDAVDANRIARLSRTSIDGCTQMERECTEIAMLLSGKFGALTSAADVEALEEEIKKKKRQADECAAARRKQLEAAAYLQDKLLKRVIDHACRL